MGRNLNNIFILSLVFLILSCDDNRLFDEYKTVEGGWKQNKVISFGFKKPEPESLCNLFVNVVSNTDYKFNNIFLIVCLEDPTGFTKIDTLEYTMADDSGRLLGEGFSDVKENKLWYKDHVTFPKKGLYKIHIQHAVREQGKVKGIEKLEGIQKIGFRIESAKDILTK